MPSSEKRRLQAAANIDNDPPTPADLPPSYENTILPSSNPWTDIPTPTASSIQVPTQSTFPQQPKSPSTSRSSNSPTPSQNPLSALSRLSTVPFSKYRIPSSTLSDDLTTLTTTDPSLTSTSATSDSKALQRNVLKFLNEQVLLPPKPIMVVKGTHLGREGQHGSPVVDFELRFNLSCLLDFGIDASGESETPDRDTVHQRSGGNVKVKKYEHGNSNGSPRQLSREERNMSALELWVKKFCEDKAENRSFHILRSTCPSFTQITTLLEGQIRTLLASTKYRGKTTVEFPLQYSDVVIQRKSSNWFTNLLRLYPTKKFEVVGVEWEVAGAGGQRKRGDRTEEGSAGDGEGQRRPELRRNDTGASTASTAEQASHQPTSPTSSTSSNASPSDHHATPLPALLAQSWWREWHVSIRNGVLGGKQGWVTIEEWVEAKMGVREKEKPKEWGVDYE